MIMEVMSTKDKYMRNIRIAIANGLRHDISKTSIMEMLNEIEVTKTRDNGKKKSVKTSRL